MVRCHLFLFLFLFLLSRRNIFELFSVPFSFFYRPNTIFYGKDATTGQNLPVKLELIDEEALAEAQELSAFSATLGLEDRI